MAYGRAKKKELNRQVKIALRLKRIKEREEFIDKMDDKKSYFSKKHQLDLTGKQWKELKDGEDER